MQPLLSTILISLALNILRDSHSKEAKMAVIFIVRSPQRIWVYYKNLSHTVATKPTTEQ
jgi:hypothetical protein